MFVSILTSKAIGKKFMIEHWLMDLGVLEEML
jgi:hypothetical protein